MPDFLPYRMPPKRELPRCPEHGFRYDPVRQAGCVRCQGGARAQVRTAREVRALVVGAAMFASVAIGLAKDCASRPAGDRIRLDRVTVGYHRTASALPAVERVAVAPDPARAGQAATLTCIAATPGDEPNLYRWIGPFGTTAETGSATAVWTPAEAETADVTCIARNSVGVGRATSRVAVLPAESRSR